jgi:hypothetical protein
MQSCNGKQAVMSALEALVLAGKGLNAFSILFCHQSMCPEIEAKIQFNDLQSFWIILLL